MKSLHRTAALVLALSLIGCGRPSSKVAVVLLDDSNSFQRFEESRESLAPAKQDRHYHGGIIGSLLHSDVFGLIMIRNGASEADTVIKPTRLVYNQYQPASRVAALKELSDQVRGLKRLGVTGTDIRGALYKASIILQDSQYSGYSKYLLIYSDLGEENARSFPIDLTGVKVRVLFFSPDLRPEMSNAFTPKVREWIANFEQWGAVQSLVIDVDNSRTLRLR